MREIKFRAWDKNNEIMCEEVDFGKTIILGNKFENNDLLDDLNP